MKEFAEVEIDYMAVAKRIKKVRKSRGVTQQQLAERCGYSTAQIGNTERGKSSSLRLLYRVALVLEVPLDYLVGRPLETDKDFGIESIQKIYERATPKMKNILRESFEGQYQILCKNLGADGQ